MILTDIRVVGKGQTGLICPECKEPMTEKEWENQREDAAMGMECMNCHQIDFYDDGELYEFTPRTATIGAIAASKRFLKEGAVPKKTWFHATTRENWFEDINSEVEPLIVHIGLKSTAMARASDILATSGGTYYLWEVRLAKTAKVNPNILDDNNHWPIFVGEMDDKYDGYSDDYEVTRYLNRWETPGALSLLVQAGALEVVRMTVHTHKV